MKSFVYLMVFSAINVALGEIEICTTHVADKCDFIEKFPKDYPDTVEELKQSCNDIEEVASCYLNYYRTCEGYKKNIPLFEIFFKYVEENCKEDSKTFQVVSRNLDCFTPTLRSLDIECNIGSMYEEEFENLLAQSSNFFDEEIKVSCLVGLWDISCQSYHMEQRCGSELANILAEILENINFDYLSGCDKELLSEISSFKQVIEQVVIKGEWMVNIEDDDAKSRK